MLNKDAAYYDFVYSLMPVFTLWIAFDLFAFAANFEKLSIGYEILIGGPIFLGCICIAWIVNTLCHPLGVIQEHTLWLFLLIFFGITPLIYAIKRWYKKPFWSSFLIMILAWDLLGLIVFEHMNGKM